MLYAFEPPLKTTPAIHWTEILTIILVTTMLFEEVREVGTFQFCAAFYMPFFGLLAIFSRLFFNNKQDIGLF